MASKRSSIRSDQSARYAAASLVLGLMFVALVIVYLTVPQSDVVTFLSVIIMAVSLIIALNGNWNEIGMMAAFSALVSLIATYFLGRNTLGNVGGVVLPLAWVGVLLYIFRWISSRTVVVPEDHAIMVARFYSGTLYRLTPPIAPPLIPLLERRVATIPLYELSQDVKVNKINTGSSHNIDSVDVHVVYKVDSPEFALGNIPNRGQIQNEVAREMGRELEQARLDVAFWEKLLIRQLREEVDDIVREVIFNETKTGGAVSAYNNRKDLSPIVFRRLNDLVRRWGVSIISVDLDYFEVADERFRAANSEFAIDRETRMRELEAAREAQRIRVTSAAEAQAEAERVRSIVRVLREEGVELSPEMISALLLPDWSIEAEALVPPPQTNAKPGSGKPDNGNKR